jgi:hypothetical protein
VTVIRYRLYRTRSRNPVTDFAAADPAVDSNLVYWPDRRKGVDLRKRPVSPRSRQVVAVRPAASWRCLGRANLPQHRGADIDPSHSLHDAGLLFSPCLGLRPNRVIPSYRQTKMPRRRWITVRYDPVCLPRRPHPPPHDAEVPQSPARAPAQAGLFICGRDRLALKSSNSCRPRRGRYTRIGRMPLAIDGPCPGAHLWGDCSGRAEYSTG